MAEGAIRNILRRSLKFSTNSPLELVSITIIVPEL